MSMKCAEGDGCDTSTSATTSDHSKPGSTDKPSYSSSKSDQSELARANVVDPVPGGLNFLWREMLGPHSNEHLYWEVTLAICPPLPAVYRLPQ